MTDDNVSFGLTLFVLGRAPFLAITESEFLHIKECKTLVSDALGLEESFHRVLGNLYEFESTLLQEALRALIFTEGSWSDTNGMIHEVNRRVSNLLSSGRAYLDQTAHLFSSRFGNNSEAREALAEWCSHEYDSRLGYRVMEGLRNYTQHRGIAVHYLSYQNWRRGEGEKAVFRNSIVPGISPAILRGDGGMKKRLVDELEAIGEPVDLRPLVREYVAGLATIHQKIREQIANDLLAADEVILKSIERYRKEGQADVLGLSAVKRRGKGILLEEVAIFNDPIDRRRDLVNRGYRVRYLTRHYTTNEPKDADES